ncbi:MAG: hypothetical protein EOP11_13530, partial [Proteobacteria bacterium]
GFELKGSLRPDLLAEAFQSVWAASDIARFRFHLADGSQSFGARLLPIEFSAEEAADAKVKARFAKVFERPFDLEKEAPLRLCLLQTKPEKAILGVVAHHLALDGWSLARLLEKATEAYNALCRNEPLPAFSWEPFAAYTQNLKARLAAPEAALSADFWRSKTFRAPPLLEAYRPETRGHRVIYIFNKKYYQKIRELAKAHRVTPFLFLLTCFSRSLGKVLKRDELLLSVPIASRDGDREEFVLGNCVNLMPFEVTLSSELDYARDLKEMRERYVDAIGHAQTPMAEIQGMHPVDLTQIHFNFEPSVEEPKLDGLEIEFYPFPITQVEKPIIINVNDTKKTYYIEIDYQFQALDLVRALTLFTETERVINKIGALEIK